MIISNFEVEDGIVEEDSYKNAKIKIAFLLKEPHGHEGDTEWSLRNELKKIASNDEKSNFSLLWRNVVLWLTVLKNPKVDYIELFDNTGNIRWEELRQSLSTIATVNIKKLPGSDESDMSEIHVHAEENRQRLQKQFIEIAPNLIFCGGTYSFAKDIISSEQLRTETILDSGNRYFLWNNIPVVEFPHPGWYKVHRYILFAAAKATSQSLHERGLLRKEE